MMIRLVVVCVCISYVSCLKIPSYVEQCYKNDPKLNECIVRGANAALPQFVKGDRKYGMPPIDPFRVKAVVVEPNSGSNGIAMKLRMHDFDLVGISTTTFKTARLDLVNMKLTLNLTIDRFAIQGPYEISGRILLLPIQGEGKGNVTFTNLNETWVFNMDLVTKADGLPHLHVKSLDLKFDAERVYTKLDNLFGGDGTLGNQMNSFLNENWEVLLEEFKPSIGEVVDGIVTSLTNSFFSKIPFKDLLPNKE